MVNGNWTFFPFKLDASISFDPDDRRARLNGMKFSWSCRVCSTKDEISEAQEHKRVHTNIPEEYQTKENFIIFEKKKKTMCA